MGKKGSWEGESLSHACGKRRKGKQPGDRPQHTTTGHGQGNVQGGGQTKGKGSTTAHQIHTGGGEGGKAGKGGRCGYKGGLQTRHVCPLSVPCLQGQSM